MSELADKQCEPCKAGGPTLSEAEIRDLITELPDWNVDTVNGEQRLSRTFECKDFATAMAFSQKVGELAEQANHHPVLVTEWGKVTDQKSTRLNSNHVAISYAVFCLHK